MNRTRKLKSSICGRSTLYCCLILVLLHPAGVHKTAGLVPAIRYGGSRIDRLSGSVAQDFVTSGSFFYQPPVLCYHQVRNWQPSDAKADRSYIIPVMAFHEHMRILKDSGYHTILPGEWMAYLQRGVPPPRKSFMLTFDDGTLGQYENALPELDRYDFRAVFFIMTVSIDKSRYMTGLQLRHLAEEGHVIGCHTWDHHDVRFYKEADWRVELVQPGRLLEALTGRPVRYFAYPFGSWNKAAVQQLMNNNYELAFQLYGRVDPETPEFTVRRILVDGSWSGSRLINTVRHFNIQNP
ncbi:polysaccharide deacetylase family protein [Niabella drilacis]|uniref:Peptidoglycan/xylan/chitin deacetylase, PgdA/CDA1 family n=1 Tax=Niabella drilacis (strain DSM 25811 / CCM 8410 / CCUG 62505 / LMG 26954 / E90) TaxID=1285928 RepID=A0A1G6RDL9_NIADE|nr:polysaccharide deacetylase family protein [Niabella drilacis]SDD02404.1 Peptidoglycan/xylan/chitin deacetylase, PgdA/CDA1 family [Niabella drilacis]